MALSDEVRAVLADTMNLPPEFLDHLIQHAAQNPVPVNTLTAPSILSSSAGVGYKTGAGGSVTQATNKGTAVTLNNACGQITMSNAALAAGAIVTFKVNCSLVAATDVVVVNAGSGWLNYNVQAFGTATGSFNIRVTNVSAGSLSEAVVINFAVVKAVAS